MNFCTHCDSGYFLKALALYKSLTEQCKEFTLHWLCNDDATWRQLNRLNLPNVIPYSLAELEKNEELFKAKSNPPCKYGTQYSQYCWTLTPYFINYLLPFISKGHKLIYCDADIYFYRNPKIILNIVGDKAVGIHSHRFGGPFRNTETGWYNVGVTVFTNDIAGSHISSEWKRWLLDPKNEYYETHGMCGDQKYLDLFIDLYNFDTCVFDNEQCSHLAPWNSSNLIHHANKQIAYNKQISPVVFFHFSHFNIDIEKGTWTDSNNGEWAPARDQNVKRYYDEYSGSIKSMYARYLR